MVDWDLLIDEAALSSLLPDEYQRFARPVRDALTVFLRGLPESRQAEIVGAQAALPLSTPFSRRLTRLAESCPVLHKLGQVLARDSRLAPELRFFLQQLESLPPSVPLAAIEQSLAREIGPLAKWGITLQPPALAEASVAVVIPFRVDAAHPKCGFREGVFKLLKPGIEERLEQELALLERVGAYLDERCEALNIPQLAYQESFQQVWQKLAWEVRLDVEQQHLATMRRLYAGDRRILIPALSEACSPRLTAMERVTGGKVTEHRPNCPAAQRRLAALLVEALIAQPMFAAEHDALFHGDPHAGNLFLTHDNRLAILDLSLVGVLGEQERQAIVQLMLGAVTLDASRMTRVLAELAERPPVDFGALRKVIRDRLDRITRGEFPGFAWLVGLLDDAVQSARLRVAPDLMVFRKSLHSVMGVVAEVGPPGFQIDEVLGGKFLREFAVEWPKRWLAAPNSRQFATRLSNLDLTRTALSLPLAASRFWMAQGLRLVQDRQFPQPLNLIRPVAPLPAQE